MKVTRINANTSGRQAPRDHEILQDLDLVQAIAKSLVRRLPRCIEFDDLVSAGVLGLIQCLNRFDPKMNVNFRTFAKYRVRGAMLDFLREEDPLSRRERSRLRGSARELKASGLGASPVTLSLTRYP